MILHNRFSQFLFRFASVFVRCAVVQCTRLRLMCRVHFITVQLPLAHSTLKILIWQSSVSHLHLFGRFECNPLELKMNEGSTANGKTLHGQTKAFNYVLRSSAKQCGQKLANDWRGKNNIKFLSQTMYKWLEQNGNSMHNVCNCLSINQLLQPNYVPRHFHSQWNMQMAEISAKPQFHWNENSVGAKRRYYTILSEFVAEL